MEIQVFFVGLRLALTLVEMNSALHFNDLGFGQKQRADYTQGRAGTGVNPEASSFICKLQGTAYLPAFSIEGDYLIGGVFSIHSYIDTVKHNYTTMPEPLRCTGR